MPHPIKCNKVEERALDEIIVQLEKDKVIEKCEFEQGDYMNQVFLREKKGENGESKFRII